MFAKNLKKYFSIITLFVFAVGFFGPSISVFAQGDGNDPNRPLNGSEFEESIQPPLDGSQLPPPTTTTQTQTTSNSATTQTGGLDASGKPLQGVEVRTAEPVYQGAGQSIAGGVAQCSVGTLLGNLVASTVGEGINAVTGAAKGTLSGTVSSVVSLEVPVGDSATRHNTARTTTKETGGGQSGLVDGFLSGFGDVSLDSIAYCIANEMIRYIGDSTVQWINSGFNGNPVFVDNPGQYFQNIADQEAGAFIQQVVGKNTGINVCAPFKVQLGIDTIGSYNRGVNRSGGLNCSLSRIEKNYDRFVGGDWNAGGLPGWFELVQPQNNIYGARQLAQQEALVRVSTKQNTATVELNWAKGYKNFKTCDVKRDESGKCPPEGRERTTTLGGYIEHAVNSRSDSAQNRLELATEFDQIVSALVNQLIKIAVNKTFEPDGADSEEGSNNGNRDRDDDNNDDRDRDDDKKEAKSFIKNVQLVGGGFNLFASTTTNITWETNIKDRKVSIILAKLDAAGKIIDQIYIKTNQDNIGFNWLAYDQLKNIPGGGYVLQIQAVNAKDGKFIIGEKPVWVIPIKQ